MRIYASQRAPKKLSRSSSGMTLLELMISVSILAVLSSVAVPSFANIIQKQKVNSASAILEHTLKLARNHAVNQRVTVIVCQASDASMLQCASKRKRNTNWQHGVIAFADINGNNELDLENELVSVMQNDSSVAIVFNQNGRLRFFSNGGSRSAGFYLCNTVSNQKKHVRILYTGRTRTMTKMSKKQYRTCLDRAS